MKLVAQPRNQLGGGCLMLFGLPFFLVGLFILSTPFWGHMTMEGSNEPAPLVMVVMMGLLFGGVGAAVMVFGAFGAGWISTARQRELAKLKEENPGKPWVYDKRWAGGRIRSMGGWGVALLWGITFFWNSISSPVPWFVMEEMRKEGNPWVLLALIFPIVGVGLLISALYMTVRHFKYGVSVLEMAEFPAAPGRKLLGVAHLGMHLRPASGFRVVLQSLKNVTTGSGKNRSTQTTTLWQQTKLIDRDLLDHDPRRSAIPIAFEIPADAEPTDESNPSVTHTWKLELGAEVPGVNYGATFDVPVFAVEPEVQELFVDRATIEEAGTAQGPPPLPAGVKLGRSRFGGLKAEFGCAREPGCAVALTILALVVVGGALALVSATPFWVAVTAGLVASLLAMSAVIGTLDAWIGTWTVVIEGGKMRVTHGWLLFESTTVIPAAEVKEIKANRTYQSGTSELYTLEIHRTRGRALKAANYVRGKEEAELLARAMNGALRAGK